MSALSQFWKHNRDFLGNAVKNVAPLAAFTPLGVLGAGVIGGLGRGMQHGANLGNMLKVGATDAAIGGGAHAGMNALRAAFAPSSSVAGTVAGNAAASAPASYTAGVEGSGGGYMSDAAVAAGRAGGQAAGGESALGRLAGAFGNGASAVGHFAQANPMAAAMGLQGLGQMGSMGTENAYRRAQTEQLQHQNQMSDYELQLAKQRQAALLPLLQALQGQQYQPARNPYSNG